MTPVLGRYLPTGPTLTQVMLLVGHAVRSWTPTEMSKLFIAEGANVNAKDDKNRTPLHLAAGYGMLSAIEQILCISELFINSGVDINAVDIGGNSVLHRLVWEASPSLPQTIDLFVANGADLDAVNAVGNTPLQIASKLLGGVAGVKALISNGAQVNARDKKGRTALHNVLVYRFASKKLVEALLECGSDVNAVDEDQATPLHNACERGQFEFAELFILNGANVQALDGDGNKPLHLAAKRRSAILCRETDLNKFINLLISKGADVKASNRSGITLLHSAVGIKLLTSKGAGAEDSEGCSPPQYADNTPTTQELRDLGLLSGVGSTTIREKKKI